MYIEKEKLVEAYRKLGPALANFSLPGWDELPDLELYMDQVISLIKKYLDLFYDATGAEKFITSSMINNYVKLGIIPPPVKKKYSKKHMAYLLVICSLKQTLDMCTIQKIFPLEEDDKLIKRNYDAFLRNQHKAHGYVIEKVLDVARPILEYEGDNPDRIDDLTMQVSASANIFKILTETLSRMTE